MVCLAIIFHGVAFVAHDYKSQCDQANSSQLCGLVAIILGSLSAVSLVSIFFTHPFAKIFIYIAWSCTVVIIVVYHIAESLWMLVVGFTTKFWGLSATSWIGFKIIIKTSFQQSCSNALQCKSKRSLNLCFWKFHPISVERFHLYLQISKYQNIYSRVVLIY